MYTNNPAQHHPQLSCPQCGHNTVVQHGNVYVCLNCNFQRNISGAGQFSLLAAIGLFVLIWLVLQALMPISEAREEQSYSSNLVAKIYVRPHQTPHNPLRAFH